MGKNQNLVITRAGAASLHQQWLVPQEARNFDVLLTSYVAGPGADPAPNPASGVEFVSLPGRKVEGWRDIVTNLAHRLDGYERIAFLDDDIACDASAIAKCFDLGQQFDLQLWQPSLTWTSYFTFGGTLHNPHFLLRYVNYIEMMCPFMTRGTLDRIKRTFFLDLESGIDLVWCSLVPPAERRCAIIDAIQVEHTRPVGRDKAANGFVHHVYEDDIHTCLSLFGMEWPSLVADRAVLRNGRPVQRLGISPRVFGLVRALRLSPDPRAARQVMDHIRHQLMRPQAYNEDAAAILSNLTAGPQRAATSS